MQRRVAAIVLPELAIELARSRHGGVGPLAVIIEPEAAAADPRRSTPGFVSTSAARGPREIDAAAMLVAVDSLAFRCGVRPGQSVAEAAAFVSKLAIVELRALDLVRALEAVAELALAFGTTAAIDLGDERAEARPATRRRPRWNGRGAGPWDTVWLDVTGCARLVGGEDLLASELEQAIEALGHTARATVADGPRIAQAMARFGRQPVVSQGEGARALAPLPLAALPLDLDILAWLGKLGVLTIGELARLERTGVVHRLGPRAAEICALCDGQDTLPLRPYEPAPHIVEEQSFEEPLTSVEPLLFCTRGLVARATSRLEARGQAASRIVLLLHCDARFGLEEASHESDTSQHGAGMRVPATPMEHEGPTRSERGVLTVMKLVIEPPVALRREDELLRALHGKLEGLALAGPVHVLLLVVDRLSAARGRQLDLGARPGQSPDALATLVAELGAWLGREGVGLLHIGDSHRPEDRSSLHPPEARALLSRGATPPRAEEGPHTFAPPPLVDGAQPWREPCRLLPRPREIDALRPDSFLSIERTLYTVEALRLCTRLEGVAWWTGAPTTRDYARVWLQSASHRSSGSVEHTCALVFRERGRWLLQGWFD